jgi:hypothetical protein
MNQRKASARFYLFEDVVWECPSFAPLLKPKSIRELRYFAAWVWIREGAKGHAPTILPKATNDHSYYMDGRIHLARKHRNVAGLLHELAHALGHHDKLAHGPAFRKRCFRLYQQYGGWSGKVDF